MQFWLLQLGAEQAETATMRFFSARKVMWSPGFDSGGAMVMAPSGAMRAFMKVLKGVVIMDSVTPYFLRGLARFSRQLGWCSVMLY